MVVDELGVVVGVDALLVVVVFETAGEVDFWSENKGKIGKATQF